MKITKVVRGFGKTVNLGNYETAKFHASLEAEVVDGDDVKKVSKLLQNGVQKLVAEDIKKYQG